MFRADLRLGPGGMKRNQCYQQTGGVARTVQWPVAGSTGVWRPLAALARKLSKNCTISIHLSYSLAGEAVICSVSVARIVAKTGLSVPNLGEDVTDAAQSAGCAGGWRVVVWVCHGGRIALMCGEGKGPGEIEVVT